MVRQDLAWTTALNESYPDYTVYDKFVRRRIGKMVAKR
jgi:hypothetical protein